MNYGPNNTETPKIMWYILASYLASSVEQLVWQSYGSMSAAKS